MQKLNSRFPIKHHLQVDDLCKSTGIEKSQIVRAALQLGLEKIKSESDTAGVILINNLKAIN